MKSGIYVIRIKRFVYVGSTKNFEKRLKKHLKGLRSDTHHNCILQRAYNKYGEKLLIFQEMEILPYKKEIIIEREQYFIEKFRINDELVCCNFSDAVFGDVLSNHPNKQEIISRRSETLKTRLENMTDIERKGIYGRLGEKNGMYGRTHTDEAIDKLKNRNVSVETRKKMSISAKKKFQKNPNLKKKLSLLASQRTGNKNSFFGKKHSEKTKKKISEANKNKKPSNVQPILIDGILYESYADAHRKLNIPIVTIRYRCLSKNTNFNNYQLVEKT